jgi:predicted CoA-binding protein
MLYISCCKISVVGMESDRHSDSELRQIYSYKNIAVVGMSKNSEKAAHYVPKYLHENGFNIIPVNPNANEILGKKSYPSLSDVVENIDVVDVFRRPEDVPEVVDDAIAKNGVKVIWLQEGIHEKVAEGRARVKGIDVVFNRCMMAEHIRLFG